MEYDALGQLLKVSHGAVYAALDSEVTPPTLKGGRYQKSAFASTTRFVYDSRRRVTSTIHNGATTAFEYDDEANLTRLLPPLGGKTDYEYYNDGRLYKVKHEATPDDWREYTYEYDDAGRLLRIEYPGGMHAHFTKPDGSPGWDANGQLLCLRYVRGNGSHFYSFEYQYDESGNRVQMVESPEDSNDAITWDYQYDWLNHLVGVTRNGNPWRFYVYDESDNRIELSWPEDPENDPYQLTTWSYSHDEGDQLLSYSLVDGVNTQLIEEFTYDEDGNMIARVKDSQTTHYDWDHNNRLKRIRPDGQDPRYLHYDAGGIRDKRTLSGQKETFHTLSGVALADVRPTGPVAFVQGHQLLGLVKDGDLYHFISDGLGTVRWVTDDAVNPVASFTCDPFGNPDPGGTSGNPDFLQHTYTGSLGVRNDGAALGLYYAQQRYYDPHLGRWLTPDPIGFSGGLNLYAYADNDPVNFIDPSGLAKLRLKQIELQLKSRDFCGEYSGQVFAVIKFVPVYDTLSGDITLEDFQVQQKAKGNLVGIGEIHVDAIRLVSPPDNPRGFGKPTSIPQNPTVFGFTGAGGGGLPTGLSSPVVNTDMRLTFSVEANLSTGASSYSGGRRASTGWFHIGPGAETIGAPRWATE